MAVIILALVILGISAAVTKLLKWVLDDDLHARWTWEWWR